MGAVGNSITKQGQRRVRRMRRVIGTALCLSLVATGAAAVEPAGGDSGTDVREPVAAADRFDLRRLVPSADTERTLPYSDVRISDDGSSVVFAVTERRDGNHAPVTDADGEPLVDVLERGVWHYVPDTQELALVSILPDGTPVVGEHPAVSADGTHIAFTAWGFVPADVSAQSSTGAAAGTWAHAVYVHDLTTRTTRRVSPVADEAHAPDQVGQPSLSADGAVVSYTGMFHDWERDEHSWKPYVADAAGVRVAGPSGDNPAPVPPAVSADGSRLAYLAYGTDVGWRLFTAGVASGEPATAVSTIVAPGARHDRSKDAVAPPVLSADGGVVAYVVNDDTSSGVELRDLNTGETWRPGTFATGASTYPDASQTAGHATYGFVTGVALSGAASWLAFSTLMSKEIDGVWEHREQLWRVDLTGDGGTAALVSHTRDGWPGAGRSAGGVSDDGSLAFASTAPDLVGDDANGVSDVFLVGAAGAVGPDVWDDDAMLAARDVTQDAVRLEWPVPAGADVVGYRVYRDGRTVATPGRPPADVTGLRAGWTYTFSVRAELADGTLSSDRLRVVTTLPTDDGGGAGGGGSPGGGGTTDTTAPTWPAGATATVTDVQPDGVAVTWDDAADDVGVTAYRITVDGVEAAVVSAEQRPWTVWGLDAETTYTIGVEALDQARNTSTVLSPAPVTTPFDPNALVWLGATALPGRVVSLVWTADTAAELGVLRAEGDGEFTEIARIPGTQKSYRDEAVRPETEYRYRVVQVRPDGATRRFTHDANVTALGLTISTFEWDAPVSYDLALGDVMTFRVEGDPGASAWVEATVLDWFDGDTPRAAPEAEERRIELTEGREPGTYTGSFELAEGIARISGLRAHLRGGGAEKARDARYLPDHDIAGTIAAAVEGEWPQVAQAVLTARSDSPNDDAREVVGERDVVQLRSLRPGDDYSVRLASPDPWGAGSTYADRRGVPVLAGRTTAVGLAARIPAQLSVGGTVGGEPRLPDSVVVTDAATGDVLGSWVPRPSWFSGPTVYNLAAGQAVAVTATFSPGLPFERTATQTMTLGPGTNSIEIAAIPLPRSQMTAKVLLPDGTGAVDAAVTVTQTVDGRPWRYVERTGDDGTVSIDVLEGAATVRGRKWPHNEQSAEIDQVSPDEPVEIQLYDATPQTLNISLRTKIAGRDAVQQPMDGSAPWSVPVRIDVVNGLRDRATVRTSPVTVLGEPGDVIRVCARAPEGMSSACEELNVTADADTFDVDFDLAQFGALEGTVVDSDGEPWTGRWRATLSGPLSAERTQHHTLWGRGSTLHVPMTVGGDYQLTVRSDGRASPARVVTVPEDAVAQLGNLRLEPNDGGYFSDTSVTVPNEDVVVGGVAEVRVAWDASSVWDRMSDRTLTATIPDGMSLLDGSVTLDGDVLDVTVTDDGFETDVPASASAAVLRYRVKMEEARTGDLPLTAAMAFMYDGQRRRALLGEAVVRGPGVTLSAPARTGLETIAVNGRAPAGAEVLIHAEGQTIGQAVASSWGYWRTTVDLPYRGPNYVHNVFATTGTPDAELRSPADQVHYDRTTPELTKVVISQAGGQTHTFDPREGLARFQFIFLPSRPVTAELTFSAPERVENLQLSIGDEDPVPARYDADRRLWIVETATKGRGQINAAWDVTPEEFTPILGGLTEDEVLTGVHPMVATAPVTDTRGDESGNTFGQTRMLPDGTEMAFDVEATAVDVQPFDVNNPPAFGMRVKDPDEQATDSSYQLRVPFDLTLPVVPVEDGQVSAAESLQAAGIDIDAAARETLQTVRIASAGGVATGLRTLRPALHALDDLTATTAKGQAVQALNLSATLTESTYWNTRSAIDSADVDGYDELDALYPLLAKCNQKQIDHYEHEIFVLRASTFGSSVGVSLVGMGLGGAGPSWVLLNTGAYFAAQAATEWLDIPRIEAIELLRRAIKGDPECQGPKPPGGGGGASGEGTGDPDDDDDDDDDVKPDPPAGAAAGLALPWWLHDPSGNVFEGVASNPVAGVTATLLYAPAPTGPWTVWNAEDYGQVNPHDTDAVGHYGWDVPEGFWQVVYEKEGYDIARSEVMEVLPPHFDVHIGLFRQSPPSVTAVTAAADGAVEVAFDRPMLVDSIRGRVGVTAGDEAVPGTVSAIDPETAPRDRSLTGQPFAGRKLAQRFRFMPDQAPAAGTPLRVTIGRAVVSYADRTMIAGSEHDLVVPAPVVDRDKPPPNPWTTGRWAIGAGGTVPPGQHVATAAQPVVVTVRTAKGGEIVISPAEGEIDARWTLLGQQLDIQAPPASVDDPLVLTFRVARSALPNAHDGVTVLRNGTAVARCSGDGARPDPCARTRWEGDNLVVEVRTSRASRWAVVVPAAAGTTDCTAAPHFADVAASNVHRDAIACLTAFDITRGVGDGRYAPADSVTRGQMASFLTRVLSRSGVALPDTPSPFRDTAGSVHAAAIGQLADLGVVAGIGDGRFAPEASVTREQMASFLVRTYQTATGQQAPAGSDRFRDDDASVHHHAINAAVALDIAHGISSDRYDPRAAVRRDQMASFLVRLLNTVDRGGGG